MKKLVIITGGSDSKISDALDAIKYTFDFLFFHYNHGNIKNFIGNLINQTTADARVVLEGKMPIADIKEALLHYDLTFAQVIFLDSADSTKEERLEAKREVVCTIDITSLTLQQITSAIMEKGGLLKKGGRNVQIVPYDPKWPEIFKREAPGIEKALGKNCIAIHHFGSTAVPHLQAKPIIDILAVVKSFKDIDITALEKIGYLTRGEVIPTGRYFKKQDPSIHLHLFEEGNPSIEKNLAFRDRLITHPQEREAYGKLKEKLALEHPEQNAMAYSRSKTDFISTHN